MEISSETLFNYLLETSICLAVFYAFYFLVLRKQPAFAYNRAYLLLSSLLALVFPLIEIPFYNTVSGQVPTITLNSNISMIVLPEVSTVEIQETAQPISWLQILTWGYLAGVLLIMTQFFWQIYGIRKVIRLAKFTASRKGYWIVNTNGLLPISSFFNYLLWDNLVQLNEADKQRIIAHEEAHMTQGHSYDVLYMSLIKIVLWFNPFAYLYFKELTDVHEYAADASVVANTDTKAYAKVLVNQLFHKVEFSLLNHFYKSQTLKRLKMMELTNNKINRFRILWAVPVFVIMFFVFSCKEEVDTVVQAEASMETFEDLQSEIQQVKTGLNAITQKYPDYKMNYKVSATQPIVEVSYADDYFKAIEGVDNMNDKKSIANLHHQLYILQEKLVSHAMPDAEGIYTVVEDQPSPEGGMKTFYEYVGKNMKYPQEARQQVEEGHVFVQFVVDTDGAITNVEVLKSTAEGESLSEEAVRVVSSAPAWNPGHHNGKTVKVKMVIPITFVLDDGDEEATQAKMKKGANDEIEVPKMSEIVVVAYR